jgi:hypothetical protein
MQGDREPSFDYIRDAGSERIPIKEISKEFKTLKDEMGGDFDFCISKYGVTQNEQMYK